MKIALKKLITDKGGWPTYLRAKRRLLGHNQWLNDHLAEIHFYKQFAKPGGLCFDIGANIGEKSRVFRSIGSSVVAVEPQKQCCEMIRDLLQGAFDVAIENSAIGRQIGTGQMMIATNNKVSTLSNDWLHAAKLEGRLPGTDWAPPIEVALTTLDALISKYGIPNFIKIDVEGYEAEALVGLSSQVPAIEFEATRSNASIALDAVKELERIGSYEFNISEIDGVPHLLLDCWWSHTELKAAIECWESTLYRNFCSSKANIFARMRNS